MSGLDIERAVLAAGGIGVMQKAIEIAFPYVHTRKQFDTPIAQFQVYDTLSYFISLISNGYFCN